MLVGTAQNNTLPKNKGYIKNRDAIRNSDAGLSRAALDIVDAGIAGGDPAVLTRAKVSLDGDILTVEGKTYELGGNRHIWVIGAGKGSFPIVQVLDEILGNRIDGGLLVSKSGETRRLRHVEVIEAGHPIPTADSLKAAERIKAIADKAGPDDIVFAAVTGGSSSLVTLAPEGLSLEDLQDLNRLLLGSGAPIEVINVVRRHTCGLKGGRLVEAIQPALAITLTLDTAPEGMPWPDMCLPDPATFDDAVMVMKDLDLWDKTSASVRAYLEQGCLRPEWETIKDFAPMKARMVFVGDRAGMCAAAEKRAADLGFTPVILGVYLEGEAKEWGTITAGIAAEVLERNRPFQAPCAFISGGETTVTLNGASAPGGPNQESALAFALKMGAKGPFACACVDSDGTDGPTDIAGGLVDGETLAYAEKIDLDVRDVLRTHTSSDALDRLGAAIRTGHTGTNLQNLRVVLLGEPR